MFKKSLPELKFVSCLNSEPLTETDHYNRSSQTLLNFTDNALYMIHVLHCMSIYQFEEIPHPNLCNEFVTKRLCIIYILFEKSWEM